MMHQYYFIIVLIFQIPSHTRYKNSKPGTADPKSQTPNPKFKAPNHNTLGRKHQTPNPLNLCLAQICLLNPERGVDLLSCVQGLLSERDKAVVKEGLSALDSLCRSNS